MDDVDEIRIFLKNVRLVEAIICETDKSTPIETRFLEMLASKSSLRSCMYFRKGFKDSLVILHICE